MVGQYVFGGAGLWMFCITSNVVRPCADV